MDITRYRLVRRYNVTMVQTWEYDSPLTPTEMAEWREADFAAFDQAVCDFGDFYGETAEALDYDDLDTEIDGTVTR